MRLYPPIPVVPRQSRQADTICGQRIGRGTIVIVSPWVVHRHRKLWDEPERFDPDRFTPERSQGRPRFAYIPFIVGARGVQRVAVRGDADADHRRGAGEAVSVHVDAGHSGWGCSGGSACIRGAGFGWSRIGGRPGLGGPGRRWGSAPSSRYVRYPHKEACRRPSGHLPADPAEGQAHVQAAAGAVRLRAGRGPAAGDRRADGQRGERGAGPGAAGGYGLRQDVHDGQGDRGGAAAGAGAGAEQDAGGGSCMRR